MTVFDNHGLCCLRCGRDTDLRVEATVVTKLLPEGADTAGDLEWNDDSHALCETCGKEGTVDSFGSREAKLARQLYLARDLLREAIRDHIYDPRQDIKPEEDCAFTACVDTIGELLGDDGDE